MMSVQILSSEEAFKKKINLNDQPLPIKENLEPLINDYFTKFEDNILQKKIDDREDLDFIVELIDLSQDKKTCIIDYQNLEVKSRDYPGQEALIFEPEMIDSDVPESKVKDHLSKIKFRVPAIFIIQWAIENNITNIIVVAKRINWIIKDFEAIISNKAISQDLNYNRVTKNKSPKYIYNLTNLSDAIKEINIIIMSVNGFLGNLGPYQSDLEHSMRGSDDATILLLILAINKRMINPLNLLLMSNDRRILLEDYKNIPPFEISIYSNLDEINLKRQLYNNNFFIDTQIIPFFNQVDYSSFLQRIAHMFTPVFITNEEIRRLYFKISDTKLKNWWTKPEHHDEPVTHGHTIAVLNSTYDEARDHLRHYPDVKSLEKSVISPYFRKYIKYKIKYFNLLKKLKKKKFRISH